VAGVVSRLVDPSPLPSLLPDARTLDPDQFAAVGIALAIFVVLLAVIAVGVWRR